MQKVPSFSVGAAPDRPEKGNGLGLIGVLQLRHGVESQSCIWIFRHDPVSTDQRMLHLLDLQALVLAWQELLSLGAPVEKGRVAIGIRCAVLHAVLNQLSGDLGLLQFVQTIDQRLDHGQGQCVWRKLTAGFVCCHC